MNKQPEEPASSRRFMSLGGDMHLPPQKVGQQKFAPSNLNSSSFVPKVENPLVNQFPDIFTTCPELRKFQMPSLFSKSESNEEQDQNKNQNKPEEVQQREEPQPVQISQPRPFVFQRFQVIPFQFFTGFQPFAPIIKPYVSTGISSF
ncbi:hypothetical protein GPJ56_001463 [Histomonas meleagridis]|uniref:uncharacterized protein n=1 Tax=Histomonas meleagridis TaxID=135588 RepID=UPI00355A2A43|nr:hypothetical protein GPJ56_001463 [Histomonas meleagridis]KAH0798224.1 hypothetical protein GO595_009070 [Histomonas meleagridis]